MFRVIPKFTGNCHGFLGSRVNEVSMASFTAAIHETGLFQFRDQFPYLGGIYLVLCCWSHNASLSGAPSFGASASKRLLGYLI
jgi:hypothetical protein